MPAVRRGGVIYSQTSIQIPEDLHDAAKAQGINISNLVKESLTEKLKECSGVEPLPHGQSAAPSPDPRRNRGL